MHIGFDGRKAVQSFTGPGNYSRFILNLLTHHHPHHQYFLYSPKLPKANIGIPEKIHYRHPPRLASPTLWRSSGIIRDLKKDKVDLFHGLSNELPLGIAKSKIPSIVTIHDLIFLRFPEFYHYIERTLYRYKYLHACKNASRIIAVSEQTKSDLISLFKIPEHKIDVVYQGCNSAFQLKSNEEEINLIRQEYNLPPKYILQVGLIEERKNLLLTVKALKSVTEDVKLVVIGQETDYLSEVKQYIETNNLHHRVRFLKNIPLKDMPPIYQAAELFVYPSEFEGFGIPIIEALYSGLPVVAATGSCLQEAGGKGSCYVHPKDEVQLAWTINQILSCPEKRNAMIQAGYKHVENFAEEQLAINLMNTYKKAIDNA